MRGKSPSLAETQRIYRIVVFATTSLSAFGPPRASESLVETTLNRQLTQPIPGLRNKPCKSALKYADEEPAAGLRVFFVFSRLRKVVERDHMGIKGKFTSAEELFAAGVNCG